MDNLADRIAQLSPEKLAQLTQKLQQKQPQTTVIPVQPRGAEAFPLSLAQQRLWFLHQLQPESPFYNVPAAIRITGPLQVSVLERSLTALGDRHEPLRTVFRLDDATQGPVQVIQPPLPWSVEVTDLQELPPETQQQQIEQLKAAIATAPFDLTQGPLLRTHLLRLSPEVHIFYICLHHIITDGWALGIFVQELTALYAAFQAGQPALLPPLRVQYADYSVWQRQWLVGEKGDRQLRYWQQQLDSAPDVLALPTDFPRPPVQSMAAARHPIALGRGLTQALKQLGQAEGATLFMTVLAAFNLLLYCYTAQNDVLVGTPVANRNQVVTERLMGVLVNILALRTRLQPDLSFRQLLQQIRETVVEANIHQDLPFEKLVDVLRPERSRSYAPLLQVLLSVQDLPMQSSTCGDLTLEPEPIFTDTIQFDLVLKLEDSADGLAGWIEYNTDIFAAATIQRLGGHLTVILVHSVAAPDAPIFATPLLTAKEQQLMAAWNNTLADYPSDQAIHELFAAQVEKSPDAVAVTLGGEHLSYRALDWQADRLAHRLQSRGVGLETLVGVCVSQSIDMVIAVLAILKAGGAYLPLDPKYPQARLQLMLQDSQVGILLTQTPLLASLPDTDAEIICLDKAMAQAASQGTIALKVAADNLAYVIYTSGSTGRPKGVLVTHRGLCNLAQVQQRRFQVGVRSRVLQFASPSFDASIWEMVMALISGATLVLASPTDLLPGENLEQTLITQKISHVTLPPSVLPLLRADCLETLQHMIVAGEACSLELAHQWSPYCQFWNAYGPTEGTVCATLTPLDSQSQQLSIGGPLSNVQVYILDARLQPVPIGVPGELHIGGVNLARGYLNRPDLTAQKFIANPFGEGRLYKTGDWVRYLANGDIEFLGRIDHQVKLRGFRIELGEIEAVLDRHPQVKTGVVMAREDSPGSSSLVAYVVGDAEIASDGLKAYLKEHLPDYMVPGFIVFLEALPLTPNGKINRKALPAPTLTDSAAPAWTPLHSDRQRLIASQMAAVLGIPAEGIGLHDSFFDLGGHSLLAMQLITRLRQHLAAEVPLQALFEHPTVAGLDAVLDQPQDGVAMPPVVPVHRDGPLPLSFPQERLWFLSQLEGDSATYHISGAVQITGSLDTAALAAALATLVQRHETLRTTFVSPDGQAVQQIHPQMTVPLIQLEESALPGPLEDWLSQSAQQPFDLETGPLLRLHLVRQQDTGFVLAITLHHIISDGWSMGLFIQELAALYDSHHRGQSGDLPPLPVQYGDYSLWQRQWLQRETQQTQQQLGYWQTQLAGAPALLELPTDRPRPAVQRFVGDTYRMQLPPRLSQQVTAFSQRQRVTPFMTLLATFQLLLARYSGQRDVLVGTPIANRQQPELEGLIGCFVNTLVLRMQMPAAATVRQLLDQVKATCLAAYSHQDVPFEQVVEALQPPRTLAHTPLFQVMFVLQNMPMAPLALSGATLQPLEITAQTAQFDLTLSLQEREAGLAASWIYNSDLFEAQTIERMAGHYERLLAALMDDETQSLARLPWLNPAEQQRLLTDWNRTVADWPLERCLPERFEAQVTRSPAAIALRFEGQTLSYGELNARANQLGRYLQRQGVGPESRVAICLERSFDLVVALLATLKVGAAYVPLDTSYPPERLRFMLEDAQAAVLVTQAEQLDTLPTRAETSPVCLAREAAQIQQEARGNLGVAMSAENLAYVIYTSGSTGRPKGVMNAHAGVCNRLLWMQATYGLTPEDRVLQKTPFSFDVSVWEFFWPLLVGAQLVIAKPEGHKDSHYLIELMVQQAVTTVHFVPSMLAAFLQAPEVPTLTSLKRVICSGEALPRSLQQAFFEQLSCELHNLYGPTEAAIDVTAWACQPALAPSSVPIGRPIANIQIYILDRELQPVPVGVPGELHIGGIGVARGYLNRPGLTAERFIPNPFGAGRLYKSSDLARYRPDGAIEYLGRLDHQVKLRGFRIELGEIEAVLNRHPQVQQSVVVLHSGAAGHPRLVAYGVGDGLQEADLQAHLRQHLPDYMVPGVIMQLEVLPLTPNGKVNRKALPLPNDDAEHYQQAFVAPETEGEKALAAIWQTVLGRQQVGIHDNFFELGGDSILTIQMIAQARKAGVPLSPRQLFEYQTIAELIQAAEQDAATAILAKQGQVTGSVPLTPIQAWFFEQGWSNPHHFNQAVLLQVPPDLQPAVLRQVLMRLVAHHDALRLRFERQDDQWEQFHEPPSDSETALLPLEAVDLSKLSAPEQPQAIEAIATQRQGSLHLTDGPIWRGVLITLGDHQPQRLLLVLHHLIVDGVSWRILLADLFDLYQQILAHQELHLPPKTTAFQDWALQLQTYSQSAELRSQLDYWLSLPWSQVGPLPVDGPTPECSPTVAAADTVSVSLGAVETEQLLQRVPSAYNTQINDVLLTALDSVVQGWTGSPTTLIHLEGHGREVLFEVIDSARTVGWFTSLYPVLLTTAPTAPPGDRLKAVKEQLRAIPQGGLGYGLLRYTAQAADVRAALDPLPTPELSFNYLGQIEQGLDISQDWSLAAESTGRPHSPEGQRPHLIDISAQVIGGRLHISWTYSRPHHRPDTIYSLAQDYLQQLQELISHCLSAEAGGYTPSDFPLVDLTQTDLDEVLQQFNG